MDKPNILFIMADQFRSDGLGKIGGWAKTPVLDRIANEGVSFTRCITNSPVCVPARVSLATGLYPHNTDVWSHILYDLPEGTKTWMQELQKAGYRTSIFGKTHLHRHRGDLRDREYLMRSYGFEDIHEIGGPRANMTLKSYMTDEWAYKGEWQPYIDDYNKRFADKPYVARASVQSLEDYADVYIARKAKSYLENYQDSRPWFCMLSFGGPHEPWDTPEPYASMYDPARMPPPLARPLLDGRRPKGFLDKKIAEAPSLSEREIAELRANYAGNITLIDSQIGEVLEVLERKGGMDNTVIVFTSDHGEMNGDCGLLYKETFLQSSVSVPLIVRTPGTKSGANNGCRYDGVVELMDIGPTLVDLAGGAIGHTQFARSLQPVLHNPTLIHREEAVSEIHGETMLQTNEWKMALNRYGEMYLLFDLLNDPDEQFNLVPSPKLEHQVSLLKQSLLKRIIQTQIVIE